MPKKPRRRAMPPQAANDNKPGVKPAQRYVWSIYRAAAKSRWVNLDPDDIVQLVKRLIEIHLKWIIEEVSDAEDIENEAAGICEQQAAIDEFAAQHGLPDGVRSKLSAAVYQFLNGGPTGDGDGPLVEDVTEDVYRAFAIRLSDSIGDGH